MFKKLIEWYKSAQTAPQYFIRVVLTLIGLFGVLTLLSALVGCGKTETQEQKLQAQMSKVYPLTADERQMAEVNAKQYFERAWADAGGQRGMYVNCRPSDSNSNGMVSCFGKIPSAQGGFKDVKMYCGYRKELVGCSDEDTVK